MFDSPFFKGKTVLITGGTGSFGQAFTKKLLTEDECAKVIIFSRDEWKQWQMSQSNPIFSSPKIRYFLGDIRDRERLNRAFRDVDVVVHAAALKQVPAAEYNPSEFIKTNVIGAMNIIDKAIDCGVKYLIALSTDKSVNPVNLYGATKLCSDKLFISGNAYVGSKGFPKMSVVRYGNVFGTRGSIVPYWQQMIAKGAKSLPVTDDRMTRFWITLDQAVDFVKDCFSKMQGGEIFIPKIPSLKIVDLAKAIAPHLPIEITGIRPGEKLHELMVSADDARHTVEGASYYLILPETFKNKILEDKKLKPVAQDFVYASNTNSQWISQEELATNLLKD
jgi:UDP-N-acetylglucosamine 4,6-dehydratase